jgi:hypothetical protein
MQFATGGTEVMQGQASTGLKWALCLVTGNYVLYDIHFCTSANSQWRTVRKRYANFIELDMEVGNLLPKRARLNTMCPKHIRSTRMEVVDERRSKLAGFLEVVAALAEDSHVLREALFAFLGLPSGGDAQALRRKDLAANPTDPLTGRRSSVGPAKRRRKLPQSVIGRHVHWSDLDDAPIFKTIRDRLATVEVRSPLDTQRVLALFAAKAPKVVVKKQKEPEKEVKIFDDGRARNILIILHKLKVSTQELADRVEKLQFQARGASTRVDAILKDPELLEFVCQIVPTPEEHDKLLSLTPAEVARCRNVEVQLLPLAKVPRLMARLRVCILRLRLGPDSRELLERIDGYRKGLAQPVRSRTLRKVMTYALAIGNFVNYGLQINQGGVQGFKFDGLLKMRDFRATWAKDISIIHVLVAHLGHPKLSGIQEESVLDLLVEELKDVPAAAKADLCSIRRAVTDLICDVQFLEQEKSQVEKWVMEKAEKDSMSEVLDAVLFKARESVAEVEKELEEYDACLTNLLQFFGEKAGRDKLATDKAVERFIGLVNDFVKLFRASWQDIMSNPTRFTMLQQIGGAMPKELLSSVSTVEATDSDVKPEASSLAAIVSESLSPFDALMGGALPSTSAPFQSRKTMPSNLATAMPKSAVGRKIHWQEIEDAPIFADIRRSYNPKVVRVDGKRIFALFAMRAEPVKVTKKDKVVDQIKVFDDGRARNMMIAMNRLRVDMDDLAPRIQALRVAKEEKTPEWTTEVNDALQAVCKPDPNRSDKVMNCPELLELISQVVPTADERDKLISLPAEKVAKLRQIEKQVRPLAHVSRLTTRLRILKLRLCYEDDVGDLVSRLGAQRAAINQPLESEALKEVMLMVLRLVNFVNHGLAKGPPTKDTGVMAFKVDAVVRLKDFRSTSAQGVSLLHVLLAHLGHPALHEALKDAAKGAAKGAGAKGASKGAAQEDRKDEASLIDIPGVHAALPRRCNPSARLRVRVLTKRRIGGGNDKNAQPAASRLAE